MLTPAGLSLITAVCTCRGRDSPRLRRFRAHFRAPLFFFHFLQGRARVSPQKRTVGAEPSVGQGRVHPNFSRYSIATGSSPQPPCVSLTDTLRSHRQPPINTTPNSRPRVFPKPVYRRVDRRENARAAGAKSRFQIRHVVHLVNLMRCRRRGPDASPRTCYTPNHRGDFARILTRTVVRAMRHRSFSMRDEDAYLHLILRSRARERTRAHNYGI